MPEKKENSLAHPPVRHGVYSWVNSKRIPGGRGFQAVRRELALVREQLVEEHGGENISAASQILVDSVIEGLGVQKLLGLYVRKYGIVDAQAARKGSIELSPVLAKNWVSYANVVRAGLLALKEVEKTKPSTPVLTHAELLEAVVAEREAQDAPESAPAGRPDGNPGDGQGSDDDAPGELRAREDPGEGKGPDERG